MKQSESKFLERTRTALTNAQTHPQIKAALAEYGIDESKFSEGWNLYDIAKGTWEFHKKEESETRVASNIYSKAYSKLEMTFKRHRDLSLILCKKDPDTLIQLGVKGRFPIKYNEFFDKLKLFYTSINTNQSVQEKLALIKLTPELATECLAELDTLLTHRSEFDKEMGESQATTVSKNADLHALSEWMDDFDTLAKIALYDTPQQLEVLGILVKS
ncbi:hypothetical protein DWB61_06435 [Ancylomarina euxinus]|uniref:Uncharacterized protein n=1 Tax=Ancylomarina euxinus TaxID=2283627 RepID=A0A425Y4D7_9BACT|nr:hypothetical protein [Ancylomarina euxinus]MCZ4694671.1 hypothetical protein [Ancylomarina euxinus]MUP14215.1 hypothetical protein [Ancylomarina euxinus]RRG23067.1 hypothetical protein DWB61_06435 [Ancylomarina euxinus]